MTRRCWSSIGPGHGQADGRHSSPSCFDGGQLTSQQAATQIRLAADELSEWRVTGPGDWDQLVTPGIARRLDVCRDALTKGGAVYLHDGWPR